MSRPYTGREWRASFFW